MAKEAEVDLARLCRVVNSHRLVLGRYREERKEVIRRMAGQHFSDNASFKKQPINLIAQYLQVVPPKIVSNNPRFLCTTTRKDCKPTVAAMQSWMNRESEKMYLGATLQRAVVDGLVCLGVVKVALAAPSDAANGAWTYKAGMPFACRIDMDDMVFDMRARDFRECSYVGHRFRAPLEAVRSDKNYSKYRKKLEATREQPYNVGGDERAHKIGEGYLGTDEDFEDMVDLWEIYLPRHRLVVTLQDDGQGPMLCGDEKGLDGALRVQKWIGPHCGPYHYFTSGLVPGNLMPLARMLNLIDTHDATNEAYRKLVRQAGRQKEVLAVGAGAMEDADRINKGDDGETVQVNNPDAMKVMQFGGPNQQNMGFAIHMGDKFKELAGNLDLLGGLRPPSKTAKQDAMLNQNSAAGIADLKDSMDTAIASVGSALAWYWYHDPVTVMQSQHSLPGMPDFTVDRVVRPADRHQIPFEELDLRVDPYSLVRKTPQERFAALTQVMTQIVIPLSPLLRPQGISPNMNAYLAKGSELLDLPELGEVITVNEPPQMDSATGGAGGEARVMPGSTERNYTRENVPAESGDRGLEMMEQAGADNEAA